MLKICLPLRVVSSLWQLEQRDPRNVCADQKCKSSSDQDLGIAKGSLNFISLAAGTVVNLRRDAGASERGEQELSLCWVEKSQEQSWTSEKWGRRKFFWSLFLFVTISFCN